MKLIIFFISVLLGGIFLNGQSVSFKYDDAGNRISRTTILARSKAKIRDAEISGNTNETNSENQYGQLLNFEKIAEN
jgi:hypothetical protein